ncbi:MAG: SBBP repeat-containing protein [Deltaproteobacteria bacterium]|nr:SBBP repeat-containing protein [Deltaproteobacteria bacterium]
MLTESWSFVTELGPTPTNVKAEADDSQITISWDEFSGASYYNLYFDNSPDVNTSTGTLIGGITSTNFIHNGLINGEEYYYIVTAVNSDGESSPSEMAFAMVGLKYVQYGSTDKDEGFGIATDEIGNSYITGYTGKNIFIAKHNPLGDQLWIIESGTAEYDRGKGIAIDDNNDIYVTGNMGSDLFLGKYNNSGNQLWLKLYSSLTYDEGNDIALDLMGNIYITGSRGRDVLIAKYDNSGNQLWEKSISTGLHNDGNGISVDASGNSYITGEISGDFAGTEDLGLKDVFVAKFDTFGNQLWMKRFGSATIDIGSDIALDSLGNCYIAGAPFIAKYDTLGNQIWVKEYHGSGVAIGDSGFIYFFKAYFNTIAKYDDLGNQVWEQELLFGLSRGVDVTHDISVDEFGVIYTTGKSPSNNPEDSTDFYNVFLAIFYE